MIYREIGTTGMKISVVGFGGMRFFQKDEETAHATIHKCLQCGINFFETGAYGQGKSEALLGECLKGQCPREEIVLSNKVAAGGFPSAHAVRKSLEVSLQRQQTDYFDIFNFWGVNTVEEHDHLFTTNGPLEAVKKAKEEGLVKAIGITTHAPPDKIVEFRDRFAWDVVILKEHLLYSRNQEVIQRLGRKATGVVVMTPLAGGILAQPNPEIKQKLDSHGLNLAVLALRYLVSNECVTSVISGMTSPYEVEENVQAGTSDARLSEAEQSCIGYLKNKISQLGDNFCTGCEYCMPCPQEVNIPGIFRLWNILRGFGRHDYSKLEYGKMIKQTSWADFSGKPATDCIACGECEEKCPEKLSIMDDLQRAHTDMTD